MIKHKSLILLSYLATSLYSQSDLELNTTGFHEKVNNKSSNGLNLGLENNDFKINTKLSKKQKLVTVTGKYEFTNTLYTKLGGKYKIQEENSSSDLTEKSYNVAFGYGEELKYNFEILFNNLNSKSELANKNLDTQVYNANSKYRFNLNNNIFDIYMMYSYFDSNTKLKDNNQFIGSLDYFINKDLRTSFIYTDNDLNKDDYFVQLGFKYEFGSSSSWSPLMTFSKNINNSSTILLSYEKEIVNNSFKF